MGPTWNELVARKIRPLADVASPSLLFPSTSTTDQQSKDYIRQAHPTSTIKEEEERRRKGRRGGGKMENVEVGVGDRGGGDSGAMVELRRTTSVLRLFGKIITLPLEEYPNVDSLEKGVVNDGRDVVTAGDNSEDVVIVDHQDSALSREKRKMDASLSFLGDDQEDEQPFYCHDHDKKMAGNKQQEKSPVKKPDKILPCPRCNSSDTKFCYYNNYNVNQPRHFCKGCQRYWTAGGTMRNVPVGSGRRKSKNADVSSFLLRQQPNGSTSAYVENNVGTNFNSNPTSSPPPPSYWVFQQPWTFQIPTPATSPSTTTATKTSKEPKFEQQNERCVWIPKALRIDNPEEAARSSIWTTLGINKKEDKRWKINGGLFGSFEQKTMTDNNNDGHVNGVSNRILYANPAALSRSINFQETIG